VNKNIFIFVVCGAKEHIDTLHFSLVYLKKHSKNEIWVLTDSSRNEITIHHDKIIDVKTPEELNHHQASIYLKTGVYKFVPNGNQYCYLDTDVIALNNNVDLIFNEYIEPITFAPDHCVMSEFSPIAINCGCQERWDKNRKTFDETSLKHDKNRSIIDVSILSSQNELLNHFSLLKKNKIKKIIKAFRFFMSYPIFKLNNEFFYDRCKKYWRNSKGQIVLYYVNPKLIEKDSGLIYNHRTQKWFNEYDEDIWAGKCNHLQEHILEKFKITVSNESFQHWNGGVFLFNDQSHEFLKAWFDKTMEIFSDPKWKTRDQGTLIATVWEFGLQEHPMLNKKWNLIADFNNSYLKWIGNKIQIVENEQYSPVFIHVYHHFGDKNWSFWNDLIKQNSCQ
jgi:hypothetical protein